MSGRAEFASINLNTLANAAAEGVKAKIVVAGNFDFPGLILARPEITSVKQLEGEGWAQARSARSNIRSPARLSRQPGRRFQKISWVATRQTTNTIAALAAGQIDAAWLNMASAVSALAVAPTLKVLADAEQLSRSAPTTGGIVVVTDRFAQQNPQMIDDFVAATIEGNRALYQDRAFFDRVVEKWMPGVYNAEQKQLLYDAYRPSWGVNGGLNLKEMANDLANWKSSVNPDHAINPNFNTIEDLVDTRFAGHALAALGVLPDTLDQPQWMK